MALIRRTVTPRMIAANRANAQRSTGPRTARGKAQSRLNALRTGRHSRLVAEYLRLWMKVLLTGPWEPQPPWKLSEMPVPDDWPAESISERRRRVREFLRKVAPYLHPRTIPSRALLKDLGTLPKSGKNIDFFANQAVNGLKAHEHDKKRTHFSG